MIDKQSKYELSIFRNFASVCDLPIITESIEKRDPPEPDIRCNIERVGTVAFELTKLIDRGFANMISKQTATKTELEKYYNGLDKYLKQVFLQHYSDAIIFIHFENSLSLRQRKKLFPDIFKHLISLKDTFEGNTLYRNPKFKRKLKWITVTRGVNGPIFDDVPVSTIGDPTVSAIEAKLQKKYSTNYTLHLLAYVDLNPMFSDHIWLPKTINYTKQNINKSQFEKLWIFDLQKKKVKFSYP